MAQSAAGVITDKRDVVQSESLPRVSDYIGKSGWPQVASERIGVVCEPNGRSRQIQRYSRSNMLTTCR